MSQPPLTWDGTGLDARLLRALAKRGFSTPTPVQHAAVPRCLEGKDVLARARTGSGKTLAYLLPAVHCLLTATQPTAPGDGATTVTPGSFQVLILVPTRELCEQVKQEAAAIAQHCGTDIKVSALLGETNVQLKRSVASAGHLVVATPGKVANAVREGFLPPGTLSGRLRFLVLDEADLLLSYGYEEDLQLVAPLVPRSCQVILMSATSSGDVERLQKLVLHNPLVLNLLQAGVSQQDVGGVAGSTGLAAGLGVSAQVTHYSIECPKADRLLHIMALLKLGLVRKKVLIFVNTVDEGFRIKLFLESFGISSALLNAELPRNSRSHILQTFNKGLFDYLIATDDVHGSTHDGGNDKAVRGKKGALKDARTSKRPRKDEEFGVTRGIDFKGVRTIINYDMPSSLQGYVHRVGRTGRAGESGVAVSLFTPADSELQEEVGRALAPTTSGSGAADGDPAGPSGAEPGSDSESDQAAGPSTQQQAEALRPFTRLSRAQVEALRYRGEDIARSITRHVIQEARARELKAELLNSSKLKEYFEDHSAEQKLLRHDKPLHRQPQSTHLRHIPAYLKDPAMIGTAVSGVANFKATLQPRDRKRKRSAPGDGGVTGTSGADPLKLVSAAPSSAKPPADGVKGFARAPRRGEGDEQLTEMEKRAVHKGKKLAKARLKAAGGAAPAAVFKQNVKKRGGIVRRR